MQGEGPARSWVPLDRDHTVDCRSDWIMVTGGKYPWDVREEGVDVEKVRWGSWG